MKYSKFLVLFAFVLASPKVFAQNLNGLGLYGASQPCPYKAEGSKAQQRLSALDSMIDPLKDKEQELKDGDYTGLAQENLPFKNHVREEMARVIEAQVWSKDKYPQCGNQENCSTPKYTSSHPLECQTSKADCDGDQFDLDKVCDETGNPGGLNAGESGIYKIKDDTDTSEVSEKCHKWVSTYTKLEKRIQELEVQRKRVQEQVDKEQQAQQDKELAAIMGEPYKGPSTEAGVCAGGCSESDENHDSFSNMLPWLALGTGALDLWGMHSYYHQIDRMDDKYAALALPPPMPMGYQPTATESLLMAYSLSGRGSGSYGCQPGMPGYAAGPNGIYGPMGNMSAYGYCGGAVLSPCTGGMAGGMPFAGPFNPMAGGGIYPMGFGPGGMSGPWGGNMMMPYGMGGPGMGGGFPGAMPGAFPGYPMGGFSGGYPMGMPGGYPGMPFMPGAGAFGGIAPYPGMPGMMGGLPPYMMGGGPRPGFPGYPMGGNFGTFPGGYPGAFGAFGGSNFGMPPYGMPGLGGPGGMSPYPGMPGYPLGAGAFGNMYGGNPLGMFAGANPFANPIYAAGYSAGWTAAESSIYGGGFGFGGGYSGYSGYTNGYNYLAPGGGGLSFGITAPLGGR